MIDKNYIFGLLDDAAHYEKLLYDDYSRFAYEQIMIAVKELMLKHFNIRASGKTVAALKKELENDN